MKRVVLSVLAWSGALVATVVLGTAAVVAGAIPGLRTRCLGIGRLWAKLCLLAARATVRVRGLIQLDASAPVVILVNHQSALDIIVLLASLPSRLNVAFWAKQSLFSRPFLGWAMRAMGFVAVDRQRRRTASRILTTSMGLFEAGRSILVFPEETYAPGDALLPFRKGGFLLALKAGVPIVPVGVRGTAKMLPPDGYLLTPTELEVRFGTPIPTHGSTVADLPVLMDQARQAIALLSGRQEHAAVNTEGQVG